jgi:hypothetical protein
MTTKGFSIIEEQLNEKDFGSLLVQSARKFKVKNVLQINCIRKALDSLVVHDAFSIKGRAGDYKEFTMDFKQFYEKYNSWSSTKKKKSVINEFCQKLVSELDSLFREINDLKASDMHLTSNNIMELIVPASLVCGKDHSSMTPSEIMEKSDVQYIGFDFIKIYAKSESENFVYITDLKVPENLIIAARKNVENALLFETEVICFEDAYDKILMVGLRTKHKSLCYSFLTSEFYRGIAMKQLTVSDATQLRCALSKKDAFCTFFSSKNTGPMKEIVMIQEPESIVVFKYDENGEPIPDEMTNIDFKAYSESKYGLSSASSYLQ